MRQHALVNAYALRERWRLYTGLEEKLPKHPAGRQTQRNPSPT